MKPRRIVVVGAFLNGNKQFLTQGRSPESLYGGQWELPGGKVEPGEGLRGALCREWMEELGVKVRAGEFLDSCNLEFEEYHADIVLFRVHRMPGDASPARPLVGQLIEWLTIDDILDGRPLVPSFPYFMKALTREASR